MKLLIAGSHSVVGSAVTRLPTKRVGGHHVHVSGSR
jgi:hypothetical protein